MSNKEKPSFPTKKCPYCSTHLATNALSCSYCKKKVGPVNKHGIAEKPTDWKAYTACFVSWGALFAYFWVTVQFQPKEMAKNLRDSGSFIPGLRPGRRTAEYLEAVMTRVTYFGAAFLAIIAVVPSVAAMLLGVDWTIANFLGGTGLLIVVSVSLDLVQKIDSHLVMRNYRGLLEG